jgi:hypothetical protein
MPAQAGNQLIPGDAVFAHWLSRLRGNDVKVRLQPFPPSNASDTQIRKPLIEFSSCASEKPANLPRLKNRLTSL